MENRISALLRVAIWALIRDCGPKLAINHTDWATALKKGISFTFVIETPDRSLDSFQINRESVL